MSEPNKNNTNNKLYFRLEIPVNCEAPGAFLFGRGRSQGAFVLNINVQNK